MKLIRYILSHGLLLAFLVAVGFSYHYRAQLFSPDVNHRINEVVNTAVKKATSLAEEYHLKARTQIAELTNVVASEPTEATAPEPEQTVDVKPETAKAVEPEPTEETITEPEQMVDVKSEPETAKVVEPEPTQTEEKSIAASKVEVTAVVEKKVVEKTPQAEAVESKPEQLAKADTVEASKPAAQIEEEITVAETDKEAVKQSHAELLGQARHAFQTGKIDKAILGYQQLSELNPDDPNVFGEMGNVFYSQGKWKQAGAAYYEAASLLLDQGQTGQVQYLYRVIQGLDKESADKLKSQLNR